MAHIEYAPLSSGFMAISILGFFLSIWLIMDWSETWGFTFTLFFLIMFLASLVSMTKAQPLPEHMDSLAIHELSRGRKSKVPVPHKTPDKMFKWYDPFFLAFIVLSFYYIYMASVYSTAPVNPWFFITILSLLIVMLISMIVDVLSMEHLSPIKQAGFVLLIFLTGPIGMLFYYVYKRMRA